MNVNPLTNPDALRLILENVHAPEDAALVAVEEPAVPSGFVDLQAASLTEVLVCGLTNSNCFTGATN